jgi:Arc/MetJ-type ribon-helix-helix transcriptional regulator
MVKKRLQVTVREDIVDWIDRQIETLRFASRSHAIEYALLQIMKNEKKESS